MLNMLRRAAGRLRAIWPRLAFGAAVAASLLLVAGDWIVVREMALNLIRVAAVLLTFEAFVRYSTRRMAEAVGLVTFPPDGVTRATADRRRLRFGDFFRKMWEDPRSQPLALFLVGNLAVRGALVVAVWQ